MSLRAQSLLNLKMYKLKKHELKVIQAWSSSSAASYRACGSGMVYSGSGSCFLKSFRIRILPQDRAK